MTVLQQKRSVDTINCHLAEGCDDDNFHGHARVSNLGPSDYKSDVLTIRPPTPVTSVPPMWNIRVLLYLAPPWCLLLIVTAVDATRLVKIIPPPPIAPFHPHPPPRDKILDQALWWTTEKLAVRRRCCGQTANC